MKTRLASGVAVFGVVLASRAEAMPVISNVSPAAGKGAADSAPVSADVTSAYVITSVTAAINNGTATPLTPAGGASYGGTLDLSSYALGPVTLTIAATDANNETATVNVAIAHDGAPTVAVATPDLSVARPNLRLQATCTDADMYGCATITAEVYDPAQSLWSTLASVSGASLDKTVSLATYEGKMVSLRFRATDTVGLFTEKTLTAFVESDYHLVLVEEVVGRVLDVDGTRVLYVAADGVHVRNRSSGAVTNIGTGTPDTELAGHLASNGAIWTNGDWIGGAQRQRSGQLYYRNMARGDWATLIPPVNGTGTWRVDLTTGAIDTISSAAPVYPPDVDSAGRVAYNTYDVATNKFDIHVATPGAGDVVAVTNQYSVMPVIDGTNIVWRVHSATRSAINLTTNAGIESLDSTSSGLIPGGGPYTDYRADGGWVAYTKVVSNQLTAWTRAPDGTKALASALSGVSAIVGLAPTGEIAYSVAGTPDSIYVSAAGAAAPTKAERVGNAGLGDMRYVGGAWYEIIGRDVFRFDPNATPPSSADAGADSGTPPVTDDAGTGVPGDGGSTPPAADASTPGDGSGGGSGGGGCAVTHDESGPSPFTLLLALGTAGLALSRRRGRSS